MNTMMKTLGWLLLVCCLMTAAVSASAQEKDLDITLTLDKTQVKAGDQVTVSFEIRGGVAPYDVSAFAVVHESQTGHEQELIRDMYSTDRTGRGSFTVTVPGYGDELFFMIDWVSDATDTYWLETLNLPAISDVVSIVGNRVPQEPFTVRLRFLEDTAQAGRPVTVVYSVSGGSAPYHVRYGDLEYSNSAYEWDVLGRFEEKVMLKPFTDSLTAMIPTDSTSNTVVAFVKVTDGLGRDVYAEAELDGLLPAPVVTSSFDQTSVRAGEEVGVNCQIQGGTAPYTMAWRYRIQEQGMPETVSELFETQIHGSGKVTFEAPAFGSQLYFEVCSITDANQNQWQEEPALYVSEALALTGNAEAEPLQVEWWYGGRVNDTATVSFSVSGGTAPYAVNGSVGMIVDDAFVMLCNIENDMMATGRVTMQVQLPAQLQEELLCEVYVEDAVGRSVVASDYMAVYMEDGLNLFDGYYYINGQRALDYTGLVACEGESYYVRGGRICEEASGLTLVGDEFLYLQDGMVDHDFVGMAPYNGGSFYVTHGRVNTQANGLTLVDNGFVFLANGQLQEHHGFALYDGEWFYLNGGHLDLTANGLYTHDGESFLIAVGRLVAEYTGLAEVHGQWYYIVGGQLMKHYTGEVVWNGGVFQVENGCVILWCPVEGVV